jgi:hypothetical protein
MYPVAYYRVPAHFWSYPKSHTSDLGDKSVHPYLSAEAIGWKIELYSGANGGGARLRRRGRPVAHRIATTCAIFRARLLNRLRTLDAVGEQRVGEGAFHLSLGPCPTLGG